MCFRAGFEETVFSVLKDCPPGTVLLAAVSGGADSTAMLHALHAALAEARERQKAALPGVGFPAPFELRCIHVDHGIRPAAESRGDAEFVRSLCKQFHIPCRIVSIKPGAIAVLAKKRGIGIEAAARMYRRRAWFRYVRQLARRQIEAHGAAVWVLTAHTADDMLETALMRIFRGSGPAGLSAMPAAWGRILRPLITLSRRDVLDYLVEKKCSWREDSTNADIQFLRNRVRRILIPPLNEHFPQWRGAIASLAETQSLVAGFIRDEAARRIRWQRGDVAGDNAACGACTDAENFFAQPAIVREEALFQGINRLGVPGAVKRANIRRFAQGKVTSADLGLLYIRQENGEIVLLAKDGDSEYGFSLLIYAPGSYNLIDGVTVDVYAIETAHTSTPEMADAALETAASVPEQPENGVFLASLPLVVRMDNGAVALKTMPTASDGKHYAVRITPKRGTFIDV